MIEKRVGSNGIGFGSTMKSKEEREIGGSSVRSSRRT